MNGDGFAVAIESHAIREERKIRLIALETALYACEDILDLDSQALRQLQDDIAGALLLDDITAANQAEALQHLAAQALCGMFEQG